MPIAKLTKIKKCYHTDNFNTWALRGIDLLIHPGEFIAVHGPSGSGKSTLCNIIGLIDHPSEGIFTFEGMDIGKTSDQQLSNMRRKYIGFIFQNFNLIPVLTAVENVLLPLQFKGAVTNANRFNAIELLESFGLHDEISRRPHELSGGQQQRVSIARAIITNPTIIIADEPTANLDTHNAISIIDLMLDLNQVKGTTFLFSTHDSRLLDRVGRKIYLQDGLIIDEARL